ncbi:MAG: hypothetical protein J6252_04830, partial [Clostridia bacterium]|nr:hypothetical protein [Clostridia bacterium]
MRAKLSFLIAILLVVSAVLAGLAGCEKTEPEVSVDEGPDDVPIQLVPAGDVIEKYARDETDYSALPEEQTKTVRLHYRRNDDTSNDRASYQAWNVWAWDMTNGGNGAAYEFTGYDDYGVYADLDLELISGGKEIDKLGFIVRTDNWTKDPDGDRSIDIPASSHGGLHNVYVRTAESTVFDTQDNACKSIVSYALLKSANTVSMYFKPLSNSFKAYAPRISVNVNGSDIKDFTLGEYDASLYRQDIILSRDIDISDVVTLSYRFDPTWTNKVSLMFTNYFDTEEFEQKYFYGGNDLGVTFDNENSVSRTTFKVWAPTSTKMVLNLYRTGDYSSEKTPYATYEMTKGEKGVFSYVANEDLDGVYYTYTVTNSKGTNEVVDPYAKSAGVNGRRGMAVNFTKLNSSIEGWNADKSPFTGRGVDSVIYEMHVRDMTISETSGVTEKNRGRFLGLAETGTTYTEGEFTVPTGL